MKNPKFYYVVKVNDGVYYYKKMENAMKFCKEQGYIHVLESDYFHSVLVNDMNITAKINFFELYFFI